jgi:WD40 repeat protein
VVAVAFAEQGELFASAGGMEPVVRLWRLDGSAQDPPLHGHLGPVTALANSPDASVLASGSTDGTVRLWRLPSRVPTVVDVGLPVDQVGYWRHALWVRAGDRLSFFDHAGRPLATSFLQPDGALTVTTEGWFAGDIPVQIFDAARHALSARKIAERAVPEIIRGTVQRGADIPSSSPPSAPDGGGPTPADAATP